MYYEDHINADCLESRFVYNGTYMYEYSEETFGKNIVKIYDRKKNAKDLRGEEFSLENFAGKPIFIDFSEIGCVPCALAIPAINKLVEKYPKIQFLNIYCHNTINNVKKYADRHKINFTVLIGDKAFAKKYHLHAYPTFICIDKKGRISSTLFGYTDSFGDYLSPVLDEINK